MTITTQQSRVRYVGSAAAPNRFPIPFPFFEASDIAVARQDTAGTITNLIEGADYRVEGMGADPAVRLFSPLRNGQVLAIVRSMDFVQETDLVENEAFFAEVVEEQFDRTVLYVQQLAERQTRSLGLPVTADKTDLVLPAPESGQVLVGRPDGSGWDNKSVATLSGSGVTLPLAISDGGTGGSTRMTARTGIGVPLSGTENKIASFAVAATDGGKAYLCDSTSGDISVALPAAADAADGFVITIKKTVAANKVTIDPDGMETIDGDSTSVMAAANAATMVWTNGTAWYRASANAVAALPQGYLYGLETANGADADHDIDIAAGTCRDDADGFDIVLAAALTKRIDAAWAVGTGAGGLDTGAVGNATWYHVFLISDGAVTDALFSTSFNAPAMPSGFSYKRRIGAVLTDGSANILGYTQHGAHFLWDDPPLDVDRYFAAQVAQLATLSVPPGLAVQASIFFALNSTNVPYFTSPDQNDQPANYGDARAQAVNEINGVDEVWTNTSQQIRLRHQSASTTHIRTRGYMDPTLARFGGGGGGGVRKVTEKTLSDAPTISWDASANQFARVTLRGNRSMAAPTSLPIGRFLVLRVIQDGSGSRTLTWNSVFKWAGGSVPTLSTGAGDVDVFVFWSNGTNLHNISQTLNVS